MEYFYLSLFIGAFIYIFGYHSRFCYGTRSIQTNDTGYTVTTWWGETKLTKKEIEKEKDLKFWDLAFNFDYNPLRTRSYLLFPTEKIRIITMKKGFLKHHILPMKKINEGPTSRDIQFR